MTKIKILTLGWLSLILLTVDWILIQKALYTDQPLLFWIWPGMVTAIAIALLTLYGLVNSSRLYALVFAGLAFVTYIAIFPKDWLVALAGLVFVAMMFWFEQRIRSEETGRADFSIRRVSAAGISVIIYAFMLLLGINIYYNTSADFKANPESFYDALGRSAAKSTRYIGSGGEGGLNLNQTLDEYLETETREQVPNFDTIPENFRQQYLEQTKQEFFRTFDLQIPGDQPLSEVIATYAVNQIRNTAQNYQFFFPLIFTIIIFAFMRTFSFVLRWLTLLLTWAMFKLLLAAKFFRLSKVTVEVQKLEI